MTFLFLTFFYSFTVHFIGYENVVQWILIFQEECGGDFDDVLVVSLGLIK